MPIILYARQRQIFDFVSQYIQKWGFAPTLKEIGGAIGVTSLATVHEHLKSMEKKKIIKRGHGGVRSIEINEEIFGRQTNELELPILGFIAAGMPLEPHTDPNATFNVSPSLISAKKRAFVLRVKGESMTDDGILDGDYVVVEEQESANNGEIVVALLENGFATLKRFFKETTRVRLEPANSQMSPIFAKNVRIQGKVVGVIRRYN